MSEPFLGGTNRLVKWAAKRPWVASIAAFAVFGLVVGGTWLINNSGPELNPTAVCGDTVVQPCAAPVDYRLSGPTELPKVGSIDQIRRFFC